MQVSPVFQQPGAITFSVAESRESASVSNAAPQNAVNESKEKAVAVQRSIVRQQVAQKGSCCSWFKCCKAKPKPAHCIIPRFPAKADARLAYYADYTKKRDLTYLTPLLPDDLEDLKSYNERASSTWYRNCARLSSIIGVIFTILSAGSLINLGYKALYDTDMDPVAAVIQTICLGVIAYLGQEYAGLFREKQQDYVRLAERDKASMRTTKVMTSFDQLADHLKTNYRNAQVRLVTEQLRLAEIIQSNGQLEEGDPKRAAAEQAREDVGNYVRTSLGILLGSTTQTLRVGKADEMTVSVASAEAPLALDQLAKRNVMRAMIQDMQVLNLHDSNIEKDIVENSKPIKLPWYRGQSITYCGRTFAFRCCAYTGEQRVRLLNHLGRTQARANVDLDRQRFAQLDQIVTKLRSTAMEILYEQWDNYPIYATERPICLPPLPSGSSQSHEMSLQFSSTPSFQSLSSPLALHRPAALTLGSSAGHRSRTNSSADQSGLSIADRKSSSSDSDSRDTTPSPAHMAIGIRTPGSHRRTASQAPHERLHIGARRNSMVSLGVERAESDDDDGAHLRDLLPTVGARGLGNFDLMVDLDIQRDDNKGDPDAIV